jgi:hypothetical protein
VVLGKYNHNHDERGRFSTTENAVDPVGRTRSRPHPKGVQIASLDTVTSDAGGVRSASAQGNDVAQIIEPEPIEPPPPEPPQGARQPQDVETTPTETRADLIAPNGDLPGTFVKGADARTMPGSDDPTATALAYAEKAYNGQAPSSVTTLRDGGFVAEMPDGAFITFRPAGQASAKTEPTTASVDINDPKINQLNSGAVLKLKFPKK